MRSKLLQILFILTLLLTMLVAIGTPAAAAATLPVEQIDAYIKAQMEAARIPGMAVAIVKDHQIVHAQGFGTADGDGRPVTPETPFIIGSTSKSFTALAIMQLVEAGKIDLDAPVQRYLPWFTLADKEASAKLTVRHLLNQTSGISTNAAFTVQVDADASLETYVRQLAKVAPTAQPGATFQYSNANYSTLGLLVEVVSGQSYGTYVQQQILAPAGMKHSYISQDEATKNGLSSGYQYLLGFPVARTFPQKVSDIPAGFINASAADLGQYLLAVMDGKLLSPALVTEMQKPGAPMGGPDEFYAMGWMRRVHNGVAVIDHPGDVMNYKAYLAISPEQGWGVVVLANSNNPFSMEFMGITDGVLSLLAGKEPVAVGHSTNTILLVVGLVLILIIAWQIRGLLTVSRWAAGRKRVRLYLRFVAHLVVGTLIWGGIPTAMGFSWPTLWQFSPDMGILMAVIGTLSLVLGALRLVIGLRGTR